LATDTQRTGRTVYPRPKIEIEFNQEALLATGCCRFVPVVIRLCELPEAHTFETIHFERTRAQQPDGGPGEGYDVNPMRPWSFRYVGKKFPRYHEFQIEFLVRTHPEETGLFSLKLESQASTLITEVTFVFQADRAEPWVRGQAKGVKGCRFLPFLRSQEERDTLAGAYPDDPGQNRETP
jgi:hypothetical protein